MIMGDVARPPVIEPGSEGKFPAVRVTEALEELRRDFGAYAFGVGAADDRFTGWREDGTGQVLAEEDPAGLRRLVAEDDSARRRKAQGPPAGGAR